MKNAYTDETGLLLLKFFHKKTLVKKDISNSGKRVKQRLTILLGANRTVLDIIWHLFIRKYKTLRCFKNTKKLLSMYLANKKA